MNYNIMKMDDLLSNLMDNVSQNQLDEELKAFRFYARKLGIRDYSQLWVAISEEDPSYILQDDLVLPPPIANREVTIYPSAKVLVEKYNGEFFIYATNEEDLTKILDTLDKFLNQEIEDENFSDATYENEVDEENKSFIDIEECLRLRDRLSNNKYGLQTKYLGERYTLAQKGTIATMLKEDVSDEEIYNYMNEIHNDEELTKAFYGIDEVNARDPYAAAEEDVEKDMAEGTHLDFDPDNEDEVIQSIMKRENWSYDQAREYFTYYWEFYENYLKDDYQDQIDDEYTWSVED